MTMFGDTQSTQRTFRQGAAAERAQQHKAVLLPGPSGRSCMPVCRSSGQKSLQMLGLIRAAPGEDRRYFGEKGAFKHSTGGTGKRKEGEKPLFCAQQGCLGRHQSGKQPVKDGGVCRVISHSPGEADAKSRILRAETADSSRISLRAYRKKPPFSPFLCLVSAISAPDHWCIGRVAISGTQSDVCVRLKQTHHNPKGATHENTDIRHRD